MSKGKMSNTSYDVESPIYKYYAEKGDDLPKTKNKCKYRKKGNICSKEDAFVF